jgi:hypothetical protein
MPRVEGDLPIERPVEDVFDFVADERNEPRFNPRMLRVEKVSRGPIGLGTRFSAEMATGRRRTRMTIEFTGFERPWRLDRCHRSAPGARDLDESEAAPGSEG